MSNLNISQLSLDIRALRTRFDELGSRYPDRYTVIVDAPVEPTLEVERIRRQMKETEKDLKTAREARLEVNRDIEKEWQKEREERSAPRRGWTN